MHIRLWTAIHLTVLTTFLSGCGQTEGLYTVQGKVLYHGEPAEGAVVYFHRKGTDVVMNGAVPTGIVQENGTFRLTSDEHNGAPPGEYNVLVVWRDRRHVSQNTQATVRLVSQKKKGSRSTSTTKIRSSATLPVDRLNGRYSDIGRPLLKAEIKPETNNLSSFELTD